MERRSFLGKAGAGLAAGAFAGPVLAQSLPEIRWRMAGSFSKNLDIPFGAVEWIVKRVAQITQNKFQIRIFAGGEIVPSLQVLDAVQNGTVECGFTANYYYIGKDPTFAFDTALPFGMNARQHSAWLHCGGGLQLMREFMKDYGIISLSAGNTGAQMAGWFRKKIHSLQDLQGLKFRIGGFGGQVFTRLGVVAQQIPASDIYPALEKGAIDAAEWVGPYDDEKLGFYKVAKYYYYPGWWEGGGELQLDINLRQWESLPLPYQAALEAAAAESRMLMLAKYDALNPIALRRLVAAGAQLRPFPPEVLDAAYRVAHELYEEIGNKNPRFKKVYESWRKFRDEENLWFRVSDNAFGNMMISERMRQVRAAATKKE